MSDMLYVPCGLPDGDFQTLKHHTLDEVSQHRGTGNYHSYDGFLFAAFGSYRMVLTKPTVVGPRKYVGHDLPEDSNYYYSRPRRRRFVSYQPVYVRCDNIPHPGNSHREIKRALVSFFLTRSDFCVAQKPYYEWPHIHRELIIRELVDVMILHYSFRV